LIAAVVRAPTRSGRWAALFLLVLVGYSLLALAAYDLFGALSIGVTFFPPAGLTFAAFLLLRHRDWAPVAAAIVVGEVAVDMGKGNGLWWSLAWAAANLCEPLVGASVTRRLAVPTRLWSRRTALAWLVGGLGAGPIVGAAIGATNLWRVNGLDWWSSFWHVWVGDGLGVLVVGPLVVGLVDMGVRRRTRQRPLPELVAFGVATALIAVVALTTSNVPIGYAVIPMLAAVAVRLGPFPLAIAAAALAAALTAATAHGTGHWAAIVSFDAQAQLARQQAFLIAAIGAAWFLLIEASERERAMSTVRRTTERWREDHEVALTLQRALLPNGDLRTPHARTTGRYLPATGSLQIGGDWYDAVVRPDGELTVIIGDVVGHGLVAAATMGRLSGAARSLAFTSASPADLVRALDLVAARTSNARAATIACVSFDPHAQCLRYVLAGHPAPLLRTPDGKVIALDVARGVPLACVDDTSREDWSVPVSEGSLVVLYTDGLVERRGPANGHVTDRLLEVVANLEIGDLDRCADAIVRAMLPTGAHDDDVAVLCLAIGSTG
jgi:integral membrane sensor domain MASE1